MHHARRVDGPESERGHGRGGMAKGAWSRGQCEYLVSDRPLRRIRMPLKHPLVEPRPEDVAVDRKPKRWRYVVVVVVVVLVVLVVPSGITT